MIKRKRIAAVVMVGVMLCMAAFTGCGETDKNGGNGSADSQLSAELSSGGDEDVITYELKLTYANSKYVETGDESLPKVNRDGAAVIHLEGKNAAEKDMSENLEFAVKVALDILRDDPETHGGSADDETCVTEAFGIGDVVVEEGLCTIDLTGDELLDQNMYSEMYFIIQTVDTILNSFDEITGVAFTVNGEPAEALSYFSLTGTFDKDSVDSMING